VLICTSGKNILVDPGIDSILLIRSLANENLRPDDISICFLTHRHLDHIKNKYLFVHADILDRDAVYHNLIKISDSKFIPDTNVEIIPTPGHTRKHVALLVNTSEGKYAIAGDVFWWEDNQEQRTDMRSLIEMPDPFAKDMNILQKSRAKLLQIADYIIPGHGDIFEVPE